MFQGYLILVLASLLNSCMVQTNAACPGDCHCERYVQNATDTSFASHEFTVTCAELGLTSLPPGIHPNVTHLYLSGNKFQQITRKMFVKFEKLKLLDLSSNDIFSVEKGAFDQLVNLETLVLTSNRIPEIYQGHFGNISRLHELVLTDNPITEVAVGAFDNLTQLEGLHLSETLIEAPPIFTVPSSVIHLYLDNTNIHRITPDSFKHYSQVEGLYLKKSKIKSLSNHVFRHTKKLKYLLMEYSTLTHIAEKAFEGLQLQTLSLHGTLIRSLPASGLTELINLNLESVKHLWELQPSYYPNIKQLLLTYEFLCCPFMNRMYEDTGEIGPIKEWDIQECKQPPDFRTTLRPTLKDIPGTTTRRPENDGKPTTSFVTFSNDSLYGLTLDPCDVYVLPSGSVPLASARKKKVMCWPRPDDFNPCEDLLGSSALRVCTWMITVCALIGNIVTLVVIMFNRRKVDKHKLLMCTLAFANLCMGLYLLILASVDMGSNGHYNQYAREWQFGYGCKIAGFLSIFSTELAVFTLNMITLERYYTIVYPLHKDKWITIRQTTVLLVLSVIAAAILAMLPLTSVSSYSKVAICLPFDVENTSSKVYVTFLLVSNGTSFFIVLFSYIKMYLSIQHTTSTSPVDLSVAKKMAIIVFTNFSCWAPIAVFSLVAIYGEPLIGVSMSKILLVFVYPINAFANPFLYVIGTKSFKRDLCRAISCCCGSCKNYINTGGRIASSRLTRTSLISMASSRSRAQSTNSGNSLIFPLPRKYSGRNSFDVVPRPNSSILIPQRRVSLLSPSSARDFASRRQSSFSITVGRRKSYDLAAKANNVLPDAPRNVQEHDGFCEIDHLELRNASSIEENVLIDSNTVLYESSC